MYTSAAGAMPCDSPNLASGEQVFVDWFLTTPEGLTGGSGGDSGDESGGDSGDHSGDEYEHPTMGQPSYNQQGGSSGWGRRAVRMKM